MDNLIMSLVNEYILPGAAIGTLSVFDLLKHTSSAGFIEQTDFRDIYPIAIEVNTGVFTKRDLTAGFPEVTLSQLNDSIYISCSCSNPSGKMCGHQAEVIHCILEQKIYRVFFDGPLRHSVLMSTAKAYGLDKELNLDSYFRLHYNGSQIDIEPKIAGLLKIDNPAFQKELVPQSRSVIKELAAPEVMQKPLLVIGRHRYYNQLNFTLMHAERAKAGTIKNPLTAIDPMQLTWKSDDAAVIKFYTAIAAFQNKYEADHVAGELDALRQVISNPLKLEAYYHDRDIAENISARSLRRVGLNMLKPEIKLTVFQKEPFYEITGELVFEHIALPFKDLVIRHDYFIEYRQVFHLINNPDMQRVIKFFKCNNEILLIHASQYEAFLQSVLSPLESLVQINYSYIHTATPAQLAEQDFTTERLIYLRQEGHFIAINPVMKYGSSEAPVYSRKQVFGTDQNGNTFRIERDLVAELQFTSLIMQQHPDFKEQVNEHEYFYLHKNQLLDDNWFLDAFETWKNEGITILGFNDIKNNKLNPNKARVSIRVVSGTDWFNARIKLSFGKSEATLKQVHRAIRNKSKFVQLDDGTRGILPAEWIEKFIRYFHAGDIEGELLKIARANFAEVKSLFESDVLSEDVHQEIADYERKLSARYNIPEVAIPEGLKAVLRDYQHQGLNWLNWLDELNFGGCLADDMGLGKTIQMIAFLLLQRQKRGQFTSLVVAPTSLLFNWEDELERFAPSLKVTIHHGGDRQKQVDAFSKYDVVLTSYGIVLSDIRFLKTFHFNYLFLDESQAIKNPDSERYKAAMQLQARNRMVLTGTPVENNTFDLYGQLSFACPGLLGSKQYFRDIYSIPIDRYESIRRAGELQQKVKPFILRRTKQQVAIELPEKTEMVIYCEMNTEQRKVYDSYERELREYISAVDDDDIHKNSMHVLKGLTRLRQICNSPVLIKEGYSGDHAVKLELLMEQIENKSPAHKILVFSQFVGMLDLVKAKLEERNIGFEYLTGQTGDRGLRVNNFQTNEAVRVFLVSLKAGGVGLNLTAADYVYLVDPWWNPAAENQAIDRAHRIGQNKNVVAVRLICLNTIEEKIVNLQKKKNKLTRNLVRADASFFNSLSKKELLDIL
ncbi:SNF2-related protein [Niabella yanshanensis]|uniref:SNF2-related protein n=1 Tax=Niabella yanshanensis TaxID=577386 RepID=A0ABZ0W5A1_9BACT|nr:DEAD/DEAH box helicase [Niabella yanshanensis]WQD37813.1 SNF2-related protein [Niabella yanshanensis]